MQWVKINSGRDLPKKPGLASYEQIDCIVVINNDLKHLVWNCEHEVWDDSDGDDFYCDAITPSHYMIIERPSE